MTQRYDRYKEIRDACVSVSGLRAYVDVTFVLLDGKKLWEAVVGRAILVMKSTSLPRHLNSCCDSSAGAM